MTNVAFTQRNLLGLEGLPAAEILHILDTTKSFVEISERDIKKVPTLRGKTVINLFHEASTRTRTSFEIAAKRLSADTINISASTSSAQKGETLADTARNLEAMRPDAIIIRHPSSGAPHLLARAVSSPVINAGDGQHEHPTQALLDLFTIREKKGKNGSIAGLEVAIVGDILHSRVARSNLYGLIALGARVQPDFDDSLPRDFLYHLLAHFGRHVERRHVDRARHVEHRFVGFEPFDFILMRVDRNDRVALEAIRTNRAVAELAAIVRRPNYGNDLRHYPTTRFFDLLATNSSNRRLPSRRFSIDVAYEIRTNPGAPNDSPGVTATFASSRSASAKSVELFSPEVVRTSLMSTNM